MFPDFFIVGAPKAGTTSLYNYLKQHPGIFMSGIKEPNYFSYEFLEKQNLYYKERGIKDKENYEALFQNSSMFKARGEASVSYLFYDGVADKIRSEIPNAKIIIMLRNPAERALSHYYMDFKLRYVNESFESVLYRSSTNKNAGLQYQQYILLGMYYRQVKKYIEVFGAERVKIIFYEDLKLKLPDVVRDVYHFLNVDDSFVPDLVLKHNSYEMPGNNLVRYFYSNSVFRKTAKTIFSSAGANFIKKYFFNNVLNENHNQAKVFMKELYKSDIEQLEILTRTNLKSWYE